MDGLNGMENSVAMLSMPFRSTTTARPHILYRIEGDAAKHHGQLAACVRGADPLDRCLLIAGWPLRRVTATTDSIWEAELPKHRGELFACQRRRDVNLASCLTLYYKWDSDRALRTADSITRARLGAVNR